MRNKKGLVAVILVSMGVVVYMLVKSRSPVTTPPAAATIETSANNLPADKATNPSAVPSALQKVSKSATSATGTTNTALVSPANVPSSASVPPTVGAILVSTAPEFTNLPPETVVEYMRTVFHSYQSMFGGNPVGNNQEITKALDGENPKQTHFISQENGMRINHQGELIDPWGTPYFFHQLSGTEMEIHSAGPDKVMWTTDDLVIK
jgi:hypothetical protein